ncbi:hypothetical protein VTJ04DRAFT_9361 [Mycothermus thermophilus]|uniref:uncharacterized protein n=1 Tax=Humicola insolens TaxID=85995 RepID=UPI0037444601
MKHDDYLMCMYVFNACPTAHPMNTNIRLVEIYTRKENNGTSENHDDPCYFGFEPNPLFPLRKVTSPSSP